MHIDPEDRPDYEQSSSGKRRGTLVLALLVVAGIVWYVISPPREAPAPVTDLVQLPEETPERPVESTGEAAIATTEPITTAVEPAISPAQKPAVELPALDDSDPVMQEYIAALSNQTDLLPWIKSEHIIRRGVTVINSLGDGIILTKLLNVPSPKGKFLAQKQGNTIWLNPENYRRYKYLVAALSSIDTATLARLYHQLQPLLEESLYRTGLPGRQSGCQNGGCL